MKAFAILPMITVGLVSGIGALAADGTQTVRVKTALKIPEATLAPGQYKFAVEDRLQDRAIVRIESVGGSSHYLVLAVPVAKTKGTQAGSLILYHSAAGATEQSLKAWSCPGCAAPLGFVYPKAEAAALTDESAEPVLAVDPSYDKMPANLSSDDMKVVTASDTYEWAFAGILMMMAGSLVRWTRVGARVGR